VSGTVDGLKLDEEWTTMSFQAYLDAVESKTGKTPRQLISEAEALGFGPATRAGPILDWFAESYGLGRGHGLALVHVITKRAAITDKHVGAAGFYSLVEAVHDLVVRPRHRDRHSFNDCRGHYFHFARTPTQVLYRWEVDQLLDLHSAGLHLAAGGEDKGRLVHPAGEDRDELVKQALQAPNPGDGQAIRHAIALFSNRAVDRENKRRAILTLVGLLEERRSLIKTELTSKDEGALLQIANQFAIRHRRADQHGDYPDAYLDWIFWCYLATVELTDRIAASQSNSP